MKRVYKLGKSGYVHSKTIGKATSRRTGFVSAPLKGARGRWERFLESPGITSGADLVQFPLGFSPLVDLKKYRYGVRGATEQIGIMLALDAARNPKLKKMLKELANKYPYMYVDAQGRLILSTSRGMSLGGSESFRKRVGRARIDLEKILKRSVPEYLPGIINGKEMMLTRVGDEFFLYNPATGKESTTSMEKHALAKTADLPGGRKQFTIPTIPKPTIVVTKDPKVIGQMEKMFAIQVW